MDISIIIPSFNTKSLLSRCLSSISESLKDSKLTWEVIVVDNRSTDGTRDLLKRKFSWVKSILNTKNVGYGTANNQGIKKALGEWILCLNSDTVVLDDAIEKLLRFAKQHPNAFDGGKLYNEDKTVQTSCGPAFSLWNVFLILFLQGDRFGLTRYSPQSVVEVDWVSGACFLGRRKTFVDVGLFDEEIFLYMEEVEFFHRAKQKGFRVLFYPDAHFTHTGAASSGNKKQPVVNIFGGLVFFYRKHKTPFEQLILGVLLHSKAYLVMIVGRIMGDTTLVTLYEKALQLV